MGGKAGGFLVLASLPGHPQIVSCNCGEIRVLSHCYGENQFFSTAGRKISFSSQLQDKVWEWPGNEASLMVIYNTVGRTLATLGGSGFGSQKLFFFFSFVPFMLIS